MKRSIDVIISNLAQIALDKNTIALATARGQTKCKKCGRLLLYNLLIYMLVLTLTGPFLMFCILLSKLSLFKSNQWFIFSVIPSNWIVLPLSLICWAAFLVFTHYFFKLLDRTVDWVKDSFNGSRCRKLVKIPFYILTFAGHILIY